MQYFRVAKVAGTVSLVLFSESHPNYNSPLLLMPVTRLVTRPVIKNLIFLLTIKCNTCNPDKIYFFVSIYQNFVCTFCIKFTFLCQYTRILYVLFLYVLYMWL